MPDVFAWAEHGSVTMMYLTGRTAKPFIHIEDPVLSQREPAAEIAQHIINTRLKYADEPMTVNGHPVEESTYALPAGLPTGEDVYAYIAAHGPVSRAVIREALGLDTVQIGSRMGRLATEGRIKRLNSGKWVAIDNGQAPRRRRGRPPGSTRKPSTATSAELYDWLVAEGPKTFTEIREHFGFDARTWWNRHWYLVTNGRAVSDRDIKTLTAIVDQRPAHNPTTTSGRRRNPDADRLLAYITTHPGLMTAELRRNLKLSVGEFKKALDALHGRKVLRREGEQYQGRYYLREAPASEPELVLEMAEDG